MAQYMDSPYFVHFGCWNNGGCAEGSDMSRVLNSIRTRPHPPAFLSVCGDNYYSTKNKATTDGKKIKLPNWLDQNKLQAGFACLPKVPIYMTYGNHDLETGMIPVGTDVPETDCRVAQLEVNEAINSNGQIKLSVYQSVRFNANTHILFLDTTIYDKKDAPKVVQCYRQAINDPQIDYSQVNSAIAAIKRKQLDFIAAQMNELTQTASITNLIIVGHHPLAQFKYKNEIMQHMIPCNEFNSLLYDEIHLKMSNRPITYYYLCADLHQYQPGTVSISAATSSAPPMNIHQYIVGTGGAKKDMLVRDQLPQGPTRMPTDEDSPAKYTTYEVNASATQEQNGYLVCSNQGNTMTFEFVAINVNGIQSSSKGGRKQSRRKQSRRKPSRRKPSRRKQSRRKQSRRKPSRRKPSRRKPSRRKPSCLGGTLTKSIRNTYRKVMALSRSQLLYEIPRYMGKVYDYSDTDKKYLFDPELAILYKGRYANGPMDTWNVYGIKDLSRVFAGYSSFNEYIGSWDVSKAENMSGMFAGCTHFNQHLHTWRPVKATNMAGMFYGCSSFDKPINDWRPVNVTNMNKMFYGCSSFNQPLTNWKYPPNARDMFVGCSKMSLDYINQFQIDSMD